MAENPRKAGRRKQRPSVPAKKDPGRDAMKAGYAKAEIKNQKVRDSLEPLEEGERPTVVTVGAAFSLIVALVLWGSAIFALITGTEVDGEKVNVAQWAALAAIFTFMAWGMWKARYWAVLGFQMLLVLLILACVIGLVVAATTLLQLVSTLLLLIGLSLLFFHMIKAMARIQMPERPGRG
ncbi:MAG: hypothetical protein M3Y45_09505 [Actinomycetota bacterium]|nr:hypothetical protein [Actinomycetota bacterium]